MKQTSVARAQTYESFARLFLFEADEEIMSYRSDVLSGEEPSRRMPLSDTVRLGANTLDVQALRVEFTRLFVMNVFPYASVFIDPEGLLNTETTARVHARYEEAEFEPASDMPIGAPDHFGTELEFVAHLIQTAREDDANQFLKEEIIPWCGIFLHAVEQNTKEEFYRMVARETRAWLFGEATTRHGDAIDLPFSVVSEEDDLHSIIEYLISPARSGFFLSRSDITQIARGMNLPTSFGDRAHMLTSLFRAAGEAEQITGLLDALSAHVQVWMEWHRNDAGEYPNLAVIAQTWYKRTEMTEAKLARMRSMV